MKTNEGLNYFSGQFMQYCCFTNGYNPGCEMDVRDNYWNPADRDCINGQKSRAWEIGFYVLLAVMIVFMLKKVHQCLTNNDYVAIPDINHRSDSSRLTTCVKWFKEKKLPVQNPGPSVTSSQSLINSNG